MDRRLVFFYLVLSTIIIVSSQVSSSFSRNIKQLENTTTTDYLYRYSAQKWLSVVNNILENLAHKNALLSWQLDTNRSNKAEEEFSVQQAICSKYSVKICDQRKQWDTKLLNLTQQRMMGKLCQGMKFNPQQTKSLVQISAQLKAIYSEATVLFAGRNYTGESEIKSIMAKSGDYSVLLHTWINWHKTVGPPSKSLFEQRVELENFGAKAAGYHDISQLWKKELGIDNLENVIDNLYADIQPLYVQLHAFVRGRLAATDKSGTVHPNSPLPAHILGNMWAQNWESLLPLLLPDQAAALSKGEEATRILRRRYSSFQQLAEVAQDFFVSLGFQPLPLTFWTRSQFVQPHDGRKPVCHGSARNFFSNQDVRLLMCGQINEDDFYTLHHEMGHLYYYLAYRHLPFLFRTGANSAFHEAIGDTIIYAAMATQHRKRLGFISSNKNSNGEGAEIVNLLRKALVKIPLLPYSLALEKWRWNVMTGVIKPNMYNRGWWDLKLKYMGIVPPITRSENDFDPAGKFHIGSNTPYIRYFLSGILQVQFFQALCDASHQGPRFGKPLYQCDIYGSLKAGNRLRAMMSLGSSQPWDVALKALTMEENPKFDARPLMDYYQPLYKWLLSENSRSNYTIGFH